MKHIRRIILTTDFSEGARKAYPFAAQFAQQFGARISLVHFRSKKAPEYSGKTDDDHIREVLQMLTDESRREVFSQVPIVVKRLDRKIDKSLPFYADEVDADLVLTAIRRRKGIEHFVLSDIGEEVLAKSTIPVFVYASPTDASRIPDIKRVLVPVTCSTGMADAIPTALFFAEKFNCKIIFLLVTPKATKSGNWFTKWLTTDNDTRNSIELGFNQLVQSELSNVDTEIAFESGVPADVIGAYANSNEIDLALIGLRGFDKGICKRVVYRANCSVVKLVKEETNDG